MQITFPWGDSIQVINIPSGEGESYTFVSERTKLKDFLAFCLGGVWEGYKGFEVDEGAYAFPTRRALDHFALLTGETYHYYYELIKRESRFPASVDAVERMECEQRKKNFDDYDIPF